MWIDSYRQRNILTPNSDSAGIGLLSVRFNFDAVCTGRKIVWQSESDLCEIEQRYSRYVFRWHIVA